MDSLEIEYFIQVATHLSFTKAADVLFVSQSSISKKIQQLENELQLKLFIRNNKNVELTEAGKRLKKYFEKTKKEFANELNLAKLQAHNESRTIQIGIIQGWNIAKYVSHFHECSFYNYKIESNIINILLKKLVRKEFDCVIGIKRGIKQAIEQEGLDNVHLERLVGVKRMIFFSKNHPLANKKNLKMIDFKDDVFYTGKSKVAKDVSTSICQAEGYIPKREPTLNNETIILKIASGSGYALGDDLSRVKNDTDFKYFYIDHIQDVGIAWREDDVDSEKLKYIKEIINVFNNYSKME